MDTLSNVFTNNQLYDIAVWKKQGNSWDEIVSKFNRKYKGEHTLGSIRHAYRHYGDLLELEDKDFSIRQLREVARTKRSASKTQRENRKILDQLNAEEDILEAIEDAVVELNKRKLPKVSKKKSTGKKVTIELLLSDIHYGKKTDSFNLGVCRERLRHLTSVLIREIEDKRKSFNVERIIIALLGDIIESATMHGIESMKGCELTNAQQVQAAITSLFEDVIVPIAEVAWKYGQKVHLPCVTGNHDRTETKRTYNNPGEENLTWIIYNTLKYLCKQADYTHVTFDIARGAYTTATIYGDTCLYEHYDNVKTNSRQAMEAHMMRRQKQLGKVVSFMRGGHFHEVTMYGRGTIIVNGSVPGPDSFSEVLGFDSEPTQTINTYVETTTRPTSFYESFPVYLP